MLLAFSGQRVGKVKWELHLLLLPPSVINCLVYFGVPQRGKKLQRFLLFVYAACCMLAVVSFAAFLCAPCEVS